jgi:hypothetical protein
VHFSKHSNGGAVTFREVGSHDRLWHGPNYPESF